MSGTVVTQHGIAGVDPGRADTDFVTAIAEQPPFVSRSTNAIARSLTVHPHEGIRSRLQQNSGCVIVQNI